MRQLIIGSKAMECHIDCREPKDLDVFSPDASKGDVFWHESFADWIPPETNRYATLDELYTIKVSHSYWSLKNNSWDKHMYDIVQLKQAGARLDLSLHNMLYKVWEKKYGKKELNLTQESDDFFTDAVNRIYDHDSIHASVAYGDRPLYESVLKDGASVDIDMKKVKALDFDTCVKLYREEIYATALERLIIPNNYKYSPKRAYNYALKKTITSLTKGWSARFIVENYGIFRLPDIQYVDVHIKNKHRLIKLDNQC